MGADHSAGLLDSFSSIDNHTPLFPLLFKGGISFVACKYDESWLLISDKINLSNRFPWTNERVDIQVDKSQDQGRL